MMPGTKPPPSILTFFQWYGSAAATDEDADAVPPATAAPTVAHATATAVSMLNSLLRMYGFPSQSNGQTAMHDQVAGP